jgi:2-succinyl-5-enolpyruvyl-6-hydroxy-3-cyclohexene-1-carboxylate synthase
MSQTSLDFRNTNALWGSVFAETLVRCGVRQAVISPGSRSTPLTIAFARHAEIEAIPVLDERSAAFFALGLARQSGRPVVLLCTSGTAAANYFPAVIEAHESGVPLLVITADRPPELRDCAAGQAIDQQKLYGRYVNYFHELAVPEPAVRLLAYLRQTVAQACAQTLRPESGPVHLNAPFRDPLPPVENESAKGLQAALDENFFAHLSPVSRAPAAPLAWSPPMTGRGLIIAGEDACTNPADYAAKVTLIAARTGWPVLADALSVLRHHAPKGAAVITAYDALLRNRPLARELMPRTVLCLGNWPTSKVVRQWLESGDADIFLVSPRSGNRDALHGRTRHLHTTVEALVVEGAGTGDTGYRVLWQHADHAAAAVLRSERMPSTSIFEGDVTLTLARTLPDHTPLFVASSMPVRDVEYLWPADDRGRKMHFNRGANGIDGTLSTALGVAHGNAPAVLLTGDLALLHDTNGFLLRPKLKGSLTVVLINNRGGGIFGHLPVAQFEPPFEEYFATPQEVDFARLCAAYGVEHVKITNLTQLAGLLEKLPASGLRVLEVTTDRKSDVITRKQLFAAAAAAAGV